MNKPSENETQAIGSEPGQRLHLAKNFQPDVDLLLSEGLNAFGVPGSGKSNLVNLLCEQLGRFSLPQLIIDTEGEYRRLVNALPHGIVATANRCPSGYDILHKGLQVVMDLSTWHNEEAAALALCQLMHELFTVAGEQMLAGDAVPCPIHLDEAGYWLPQAQVDYLSKDTRRALYSVFQRLVNRGRKAGLVPFLYTQFISQVHKDVIRRGGVLVLMRQTLDIDLRRYAEYIPDFDDERQSKVRAFPKGRAAVVLPDGSCPVVTFARCKTEHASATPRAHAALSKFAGTALDVSSLQMRSMDTAEPVAAPTHAQAESTRTIRTSTSQAQPARAKQPASINARVAVLLKHNPRLTGVELAAMIGCKKGTAQLARRTYLKTHQVTTEAAPVRSSIETRIRALLVEDPQYTPSQLARRAHCSYTDAKKWLARIQQEPLPVALATPAPAAPAERVRHAIHPTQQPTARQVATKKPTVPAQPTGSQVLDRVFALLAEKPDYDLATLASLAHCSEQTAAIAQQIWLDKQIGGVKHARK